MTGRRPHRRRSENWQRRPFDLVLFLARQCQPALLQCESCFWSALSRWSVGRRRPPPTALREAEFLRSRDFSIDCCRGNTPTRRISCSVGLGGGGRMPLPAVVPPRRTARFLPRSTRSNQVNPLQFAYHSRVTDHAAGIGRCCRIFQTL